MPTACDTSGVGGALQEGEAALLKAAFAGDRDALGKLLQGHADVLRSRLAGKIGRSHRSLIDVSDVIQVTYIEAFLRITQFENKGEGSFLAWLTKSAENNLLDAVRALNREKRRPRQVPPTTRMSDDSWTTLAATLARSSSTASRTVSMREAKEFLREAIPRLPPLYQRVVELYDLTGLPAEEVGELVGGKSRAAVYMLSARAHGHLADLLGSWAKYFSSKG